MDVILLEKIGNLGEIGETASVKSGFARNFLFPQGKAIPATKANLAEFEERKSELMAAHNENMAEARKRADKVDNMKLTIEVNASEEGQLFGSVGTREIADALNETTDADIQKSEVLLPHGVIRELGNYDISLDLGFDVGAEIVLSVVGAQSVGVTDDGSIIAEIEEAEVAEDEAAADEQVEGSAEDKPEAADS
jgi:large subunit ribosomal protein L9